MAIATAAAVRVVKIITSMVIVFGPRAQPPASAPSRPPRGAAGVGCGAGSPRLGWAPRGFTPAPMRLGEPRAFDDRSREPEIPPSRAAASAAASANA